MVKPHFEQRSLELLTTAHHELSAGLDSLGGKRSNGYVDNFKFWSSVYMGHVSQGFIHLRRGNGLKESRFLVRPAVELTIKQQAIACRPDLIYRLGLTETFDDRTWLRALSKQAGQEFDEAKYQVQIDEFTEECTKLFPWGDLKPEKISIQELARATGPDGELYYNSHYRTYCKFTHATLRVIIGSLDEVASEEDNLTMIVCILSALETIISIGARAPNLDKVRQRREELTKERMGHPP
jgi:hypothetical protein